MRGQTVTRKPAPRWRDRCIALSLFALVFGVHAALPFVAMPTLGQALWITGFGTSFARGGLLNLYAHNFGFPAPAPIVFGLPGAYPAGLCIAAGMHPGDAYALVICLWLAVAFVGASRAARLLQLPPPVASLAAATWLTLPLVWNHAHYSMLSMGFALLPTYLVAPLALCRPPLLTRPAAARVVLAYALAAVVAVFMDGYTFMCFAVGATFLLAWTAWAQPPLRRQLLRLGVPAHVVSLLVAFGLYRAYVGRTEFYVEPMEAFRAWGVDLRFLVLPTRGTHWLADLVGYSEPRSVIEQFGDASVWQTTFVLPLLLAGAWAWLRTRARSRLALAFWAMALFGGYMALGPSVKCHDLRPVSLQARHDPLMPPELAGPQTGTSLLSKHLPGFKNMRASYRWMGLSALGLWLLILLWLAQPGARRRYLVLVGIVLLNLPEPVEKWRVALDYRADLRQLDAELLDDLRGTLRPQERVVFLPFGNDFIINYLASQLDLRAYNIGGDKNLAQARLAWPPTLLEFPMLQVDPGFVPRVQALLARDADAVVVPYFDMLWAAHHWPCGEQHLAKCPPEIAADRAPTVRALQALPGLKVTLRPLYAVVRNVK